MAMDPVVSHPMLAPLRRSIVAAGRPDIMVAFVAVIAGLPFVSLSGRRAAPFVHWRGWPNANHDLRKRCRRDQDESEQQCQCDFLHENRPLQGWVLVNGRAGSSCSGNERCAAYALRAHCDPHTSLLYHPDFLRDVPDCSVQHSIKKKASTFRQEKECGAHLPLSFLLFFGLLPVAFDQDPAVTAMLPAMRNPDRAMMRGANPVAVNPDVAVAIPAVIAVDPNPTFMRRMVVDLDDRLGRRNAHNDLRHTGGRNETDSKQQRQRSFFHRNFALHGTFDWPGLGKRPGD